MSAFDHTRIDEAQPMQREDAKSVMTFTYLVMDYMDHLKTVSVDITAEEDQREHLSAMGFVKLIDTDHSWSIARQYMLAPPADSNPATEKRDRYLSGIWQAVQHRMDELVIPDRKEQLQKWEANLLWDRVVAHVNFIASLAGPQDQKRADEVANVLAVLDSVFPLRSRLHEKADASTSRIQKLSLTPREQTEDTEEDDVDSETQASQKSKGAGKQKKLKGERQRATKSAGTLEQGTISLKKGKLSVAGRKQSTGK